MLFKKPEKISEENISIPIYGKHISKDLKVFYNPVMKLNRDISLLVINSYFTKPIKFCDPMVASAIRELRFLKTIPDKFKSMTLGDISKTAIKNAKKNFKANKISTKKCEFKILDANQTISSAFFDFIEIDPFGSPVPFLDAACQKIKHNGILSVTATDTAALCGTYPKTSLRKYGIKVEMTQWFEELGLRNLIAYSQRQAAKYEKALTPIISYTSDHYYKIFFKVEESRTKAYQTIKNLKYISWDKKTQDIQIQELETKDSLGKTYLGKLCDKDFLKTLDLSLIEDNKKISKLIESLLAETDLIGHYNPHKLQKQFKLQKEKKYSIIIEELQKRGFEVSRPHNNRFGIKTNAKGQDIVDIINN